MLRHCDGTDPNVIRVIPDEEGPLGQRDVPCECGLTFDDEQRSVIYPHRLLDWDPPGEDLPWL